MAKPASALTASITDRLKTLIEGPPELAKLDKALRLLAKWRSELVVNAILRQSGNTVQSGPFKGMIYSERSAEGARAARLIGSYEASLAPVIEEVVTRGYGLVIDVGAAEGFYAVGLARRMPQAQVWARDANARAQVLCAQLAAANGVAARVQIGGLMQHSDFAVCAAQPTLVICDIEGAEAELLDPALAPGLLAADILVEVHDCFQPGLSDRLSDRFRATHEVRKIGRVLDAACLPDWMQDLSDMDRLLALWEWRSGPTPWLWMVRK